MEDHLAGENLNSEAHVLSTAFAKANKRSSSSSDTSSSVSSGEGSPHDVPKLEAHLYYAGLSGHSGPKLVYRTSCDKFVPPDGPEAYRRLMRLRTVPENHKLGKDGLWDRIRAERGIQLSSVDLVRFTWVEKNDDQEDQEDDDDDEEGQEGQDDVTNYDDIAPITPVVDGTVYTTPVTIWVGVMPETTTGEHAYNPSRDILNLLQQYNITDVDVAYRESEVKFSGSPELFAPVSDLDPVKDVIDSLSTPLSLPIAGSKTKMQGTLGFYFRIEEDLYAVTARHVLFRANEANVECNYVAGPKKKVIVMGRNTFTNHLAFLQSTIGPLLDTAEYLKTRITSLTAAVDGGGSRAEQSRLELPETQEQLVKTRTKIDALKAHFVTVKKTWSKAKDRVIGHVVWAPPISVATPPYYYTQDVCVIKLEKDKFRHFRRNVLSLGPEISPANFKKLMCEPFDAPNEFVYPPEGLFELRGILTEEEIHTPNNKPLQGAPFRLGNLSGFLSHVRRYFIAGSIDSIEVAIHPHNDSGPFSRGGDSGSVIVDARGRFVALLTGGTGKTGASDITFGTPMHWLWPFILAKFDGANLLGRRRQPPQLACLSPRINLTQIMPNGHHS
ncbi:uncharacterized protein B0H18DRAFT_1093306 [Fomitopsis serialis]|uniref:uncharacterized protein n=1 Tax=Fomitopsis serialis TaxID=139415 RepID=UPI00200797BC|nr:uncharacterized protein B0H18DRAFT_1093306 [Neoantrodia serialis]KAH9931504.1 hypothetical protein B0H18DRAFT_1093306 [Neoantrodia serialis]